MAFRRVQCSGEPGSLDACACVAETCSRISGKLEAHHFNFGKVFSTANDDVKRVALEATWEQLYSGEFKSELGVQLKTTSLHSACLGDFLAFCLSHGALESSGRLVALSFKIIMQVGLHLDEHQLRLSLLHLVLNFVSSCLAENCHFGQVPSSSRWPCPCSAYGQAQTASASC